MYKLATRNFEAKSKPEYVATIFVITL